MTDAAPPHPPLLAARGLTFSRNDEPVFGPLEFAVDAGEALLVQGGNGVGKTTLLRVLAGLLRADRGEIIIDGRAANATQRSRAIGLPRQRWKAEGVVMLPVEKSAEPPKEMPTPARQRNRAAATAAS